MRLVRGLGGEYYRIPEEVLEACSIPPNRLQEVLERAARSGSRLPDPERSELTWRDGDGPVVVQVILGPSSDVTAQDARAGRGFPGLRTVRIRPEGDTTD